MKSLINLCAAALIFSSASQGQAPGKDPRYKQYAGRYGNSNGICLFEDGKFMLYGYATIVFGSYSFDKDLLRFKPDKPERFAVYAHKNPAIGDSTRINFAGFERGETFVQFNKEPLNRVFNRDANCFDAPFVYQRPGRPEDILLTQTIDGHIEEGKPENSWHYKNDKGYNDFLMVYNSPSRENQDFAGEISNKEPGVLLLSNFGGDKGYSRQETDREWNDILQMKKEYEGSGARAANPVYANRHYKIFSPDLSQYAFDEKTQQFISRSAAENEAHFRKNQYNDDRYLRAYVLLQPISKAYTDQTAGDDIPFIFFTVCGEGSEKSYRYTGITREGEDNNGPIPTTTAPVSQ